LSHPSVAADLRLTPQAKTILRHLKQHDHISNMKALAVYGVSRLAACIYEIRKAGYEVTAETKRDDVGHKYTKYRLAERTVH
jgi:hypothetical protein